MNSFEMAIDAILWLKQKNRCFLHCTEFGDRWRADAIGYNGKDLIEIEVKTSWADFKNDFKNKKTKHQILLDSFSAQEKQKSHEYIPNYMYYLVTEDVKDNALKYLRDNNLPYGLKVYKKRIRGSIVDFTSLKRVERIHSDKVDERHIRAMMARMSNEYVYGFLDLKNRMKNEIELAIEKTFSGIVEDSFIEANETIKGIFQ